jgi:hypothetical protein
MRHASHTLICAISHSLLNGNSHVLEEGYSTVYLVVTCCPTVEDVENGDIWISVFIKFYKVDLGVY